MNTNNAERPLVSLVFPVFNAMPYFVESLDAVPAQGLGPSELEVILVNGGSDVGSAEVLAEYSAEEGPAALTGVVADRCTARGSCC